MKESEIQKQILDYLKSLGYVFAWRAHNQGPRGPGGRRMRHNTLLGLPDIQGYFTDDTGRYKRGIAIFIEVKKPGGTISDSQAMFLENAKKYGCFAMVARSLEDVITELELW